MVRPVEDREEVSAAGSEDLLVDIDEFLQDQNMLQHLPAVLVLQTKPASRGETESDPGNPRPLPGHRTCQRLLCYEETGEEVDPLVRVFPVRHETFLRCLDEVEDEELSVLSGPQTDLSHAGRH